MPFWKRATQPVIIDAQRWEEKPGIGGKIEYSFIVNPDVNSPIEGILVSKSDYPTPLVAISLVGRFTGSRAHEYQHITLRSETLFPTVAGLIKKFDDGITNDDTLTLTSRINIVTALSKKLGSEVASKAVLVATYVYYEDVGLLHQHAPTRKEMSKGAVGYAANNMHFSAAEVQDIKRAAETDRLMPSNIQAQIKENKAVKTLTESPVLSSDKAIRAAMAEALRTTLAQGRSPTTGQFL